MEGHPPLARTSHGTCGGRWGAPKMSFQWDQQVKVFLTFREKHKKKRDRGNKYSEKVREENL